MKLSAPLSAFLNVTSRCNLSCGYCSSPAANTSDLTQEHLRLIAKKLLASEVFRIIITGGEPLCSDSTFDIISLLNGRAAVTMNSNGTLIDMETARFLSRNRVKVSISLDGPDDVTNARSRGLGTFEAAIKGIESCMRAGVRVTILVTVNAFNYNTVDAMCDLCSDLGVSEVSFNPVMAIGRAAQNTNYLLSDDHHHYLVFSFQNLSNRQLPFQWSASEWTFALTLQESWRRKEVRDNSILKCGVGDMQVAIASDGTLIPCNNMPGLSIGNLVWDDLEQIWTTSPVLASIRALKSLKSVELKSCRNCQLNALCGGGCRARAWLESKDILGDCKCWYPRYICGGEFPCQANTH